MKAEKSFTEAIFRAQPSTDKDNQAQEQLYSMNQQAHSVPPYHNAQGNQLNESHHNLMQSWFNLRSLDNDLAKEGKLKD